MHKPTNVKNPSEMAIHVYPMNETDILTINKPKLASSLNFWALALSLFNSS
jgi:hypothetical protein